MDMKVLICNSVNMKKKISGLDTPSQKNNCIIFSKFPYHNCANRELRKTSKQLLVIFHNKFPYKNAYFVLKSN